MKKNQISYIKALSALIGTTIGVGIFGVPYAIAQSGVFIGLVHIVIIGIILIVVNLLLGEIALRTPDGKRFVGIARSYLDKKGEVVTSIATILSFWASLLAYIIVAGEFLFVIFNEFAGFGGTPFLYSLIFFGLGSVLILKGISYISKAEFLMVILLFVAIGAILLDAIQHVDYTHFLTFNIESVFLPYGVVLFALGSASAIPFVEEVLGANKKALRRSIINAGLLSTAFTILFSLIIVGVTGTGTSPEAIRGLVGILGNGVVLFGAIFGFFALITSYLVIGEHQTNIFRYDFGVNKYLSWILACGVPLALYVFATQNFITVINIAGGVFGALLSIIVAYVYLKTFGKKTREPEYVVKYGKFWAYIVFFVFGLGMLYQFYFLWCNC